MNDEEIRKKTQEVECYLTIKKMFEAYEMGVRDGDLGDVAKFYLDMDEYENNFKVFKKYIEESDFMLRGFVEELDTPRMMEDKQLEEFNQTMKTIRDEIIKEEQEAKVFNMIKEKFIKEDNFYRHFVLMKLLNLGNITLQELKSTKIDVCDGFDKYKSVFKENNPKIENDYFIKKLDEAVDIEYIRKYDDYPEDYGFGIGSVEYCIELAERKALEIYVKQVKDEVEKQIKGDE